MAHSPRYALFRAGPDLQFLIEIKTWQRWRDDPDFQFVSAVVAHRWVRLGKPNRTQLRVGLNGRVTRSGGPDYAEEERMRDHHRRLILAAQKAGATQVRIVKHGQRHHRMTFLAADGAPHTMPVATSPSDHRTDRNTVARIRRILRMAAEKPSGETCKQGAV
jgi:hypothetical protein